MSESEKPHSPLPWRHERQGPNPLDNGGDYIRASDGTLVAEVFGDEKAEGNAALIAAFPARIAELEKDNRFLTRTNEEIAVVARRMMDRKAELEAEVRALRNAGVTLMDVLEEARHAVAKAGDVALKDGKELQPAPARALLARIDALLEPKP